VTEEKNELFELLDQAQRISQKLQQSVGEDTFEASSGGGVVKIVATPSLDIRSVHIDPSVIDPADPELLEDLVLAAIRDAIEQASERGRKVLGDDSLSGLANLAELALGESGVNNLSQMVSDLLGGMMGLGEQSHAPGTSTREDLSVTEHADEESEG